MAKHHMANIFAFCVGALEGFSHDLSAQLSGGNVFEAAPKCANGGAHCADNDDFTAHVGLLRFELM
jgi:hypothetical protein